MIAMIVFVVVIALCWAYALWSILDLWNEAIKYKGSKMSLFVISILYLLGFGFTTYACYRVLVLAHDLTS